MGGLILMRITGWCNDSVQIEVQEYGERDKFYSISVGYEDIDKLVAALVAMKTICSTNK